MRNSFESLSPHDTGAEQATLGSLVLCGTERTVFRCIRRTVWREAFFGADHQILFTVLCEMDDAEIPVDSVTLTAQLKTRGLYEEIGGGGYLAQILQAVPSYHNGEHYGRIVAERSRERDACRIIQSLHGRLCEPHREESAAIVIQDDIAKLWKVAVGGRDLKLWSIGEAVDRFIRSRLNGERPASLDVGIEEIDRDYRGLFTFGGYTLVAARPSMGKSTFIRWLLDGLAGAGTHVGLIAVEENEDKIAGNVLSARTGIENSALAYGKWGDTDAIDREAVKLRASPFYGTDAALNLADVLTAADLLITQHACKVIAVDHIHLIDSERNRGDKRVDQVTEISKALKNLFKQRGVVGIVAAQLNRPEKAVCPPPPALSDLRDCGGLEEHADGVLMLHRRDYYFRGHDNYTPDGLCEMLIRKNRNGAVGQVVMKAELKYQRFGAMVAHDPF